MSCTSSLSDTRKCLLLHACESLKMLFLAEDNNLAFKAGGSWQPKVICKAENASLLSSVIPCMHIVYNMYKVHKRLLQIYNCDFTMWFSDTVLGSFLSPSFTFNKMNTKVQSSDRIMLNELRCTDTYVWLSMHYIKLPKCVYKTERENLKEATLSRFLTTLQICFKLKPSTLDTC